MDCLDWLNACITYDCSYLVKNIRSHGRTKRGTNGRTNWQTYVRTDIPMNRRTDGQMYGFCRRTDGQTYGWTYQYRATKGLTGGWPDRWMEVQADGLTYGRMHRRINRHLWMCIMQGRLFRCVLTSLTGPVLSVGESVLPSMRHALVR